MKEMRMKMHAAIAAVVSAGALSAATVGPGWCVAYPDVGSNDVNRVLRTAAEEVRADINEATELKLRALPASKAKPPAIYVGAEFAKKAGFDLSGLNWYDNVIAEKDGSIYLFGNDRPGRDAAKFGRVDWFRCVIPSARAATRFLEIAAGVRFLMPGEIGKEVPKREAVSLADGSRIEERPMQIYGSGRTGTNKSLIFLVANGVWGMGAFHSYGGHTYPYACPGEKYYKTHPEYFGLRNGMRILGPTKGQTPLCISNPEVEQLIVDELKLKFDMGADVCQLAQNDGAMVCQCENCRAMYGTGDDWGEKFWLFHRHIAERIQKERPGKIVHIINYGATAQLPKTFREFPDNVMVEMCRYGEREFAAWKRYKVPHGFTVYTYLSGNYVPPGFVARHSFVALAQLARRFRENNVRGVYRCGNVGDLFGTEGPGYYVYNKLLQDGTLNVNELLIDYCSAAFGPAAAQMRKFYDIQDARLRMFDKLNEGFPEGIAAGLSGYTRALPRSPLDLHGWMFSPDTTAKMEECLARAEGTDGLSAKQRKRLELVRMEFDYAKSLGTISALYAVYKVRPSKVTIEPLLEEIEKRNAMLDRICGGGSKPKCLEGWPELEPFGSGCTRRLLDVNGRLAAPIGAPLTWPVDEIRSTGILPGVSVKEVGATRVAAPPTFEEFGREEGWTELSGISMEKVPYKSRFKAVYDDSCLYVITESDLADDVKLQTFPLDGPIWNDDSVDIMLAPSDSREVHYHFVYGMGDTSRYDDATGLITNPLYPGYGKPDSSWNGKGWRTENRQGGGKWRSIVKFPYSDFGVAAPRSGDRWFINVGHCFKGGKDRRIETCMLWSPNVESRSLVAPNAMGRLVFR